MMKKLIAVLVASLGLLSASANTCSFVARGQYDMSTNAPNISIHYAANNSVTQVGSNWTHTYAVNNNDIWTISYPCTDDQLHNTVYGPSDPVIVSGYYVERDASNTIVNSAVVWIRMPRGYSGASLQFYIDPSTPGSLQWKCLSLNPVCQPADQSFNFSTSNRMLAFKHLFPFISAI